MAKQDRKVSGNITHREVEIELDGKTYTVRAFGLDDYGRIENFIKSKYAKLYRESAEGLDPEKVEQTVREILKEKYTPEELAEEQNAVDCLVYMAYLMMRHNKGITRDNFSEVATLSNLGIIRGAMDEVSVDAEDTEGAEEPKGEGADENPPPATEKNA